VPGEADHTLILHHQQHEHPRGGQRPDRGGDLRLVRRGDRPRCVREGGGRGGGRVSLGHACEGVGSAGSACMPCLDVLGPSGADTPSGVAQHVRGHTHAVVGAPAGLRVGGRPTRTCHATLAAPPPTPRGACRALAGHLAPAPCTLWADLRVGAQLGVTHEDRPCMGRRVGPLQGTVERAAWVGKGAHDETGAPCRGAAHAAHMRRGGPAPWPPPLLTGVLPAWASSGGCTLWSHAPTLTGRAAMQLPRWSRDRCTCRASPTLLVQVPCLRGHAQAAAARRGVTRPP
jgi:hypothetical protein